MYHLVAEFQCEIFYGITLMLFTRDTVSLHWLRPRQLQVLCERYTNNSCRELKERMTLGSTAGCSGVTFTSGRIRFYFLQDFIEILCERIVNIFNFLHYIMFLVWIARVEFNHKYTSA